jgi:hypothetical protein
MSTPEATVKKAMGVLQSVEKPAMQSRMFLGTVLFSVTWKALLFYGIYVELDSSVLLAMVTAAGGVEGISQGGRAWLDKHVKTEKMKALNGHAAAEDPEMPAETT